MHQLYKYTLGHRSIGKHKPCFFSQHNVESMEELPVCKALLWIWIDANMFNSSQQMAGMLSLARMWNDPTANLLLGLPDRCFPVLPSLILWVRLFLSCPCSGLSHGSLTLSLLLALRTEYKSSAPSTPEREINSFGKYENFILFNNFFIIFPIKLFSKDKK